MGHFSIDFKIRNYRLRGIYFIFIILGIYCTLILGIRGKGVKLFIYTYV